MTTARKRCVSSSTLPFPPCGGRCHCEAMTDEGLSSGARWLREAPLSLKIYHRAAERRGMRYVSRDRSHLAPLDYPSSGPSGHLRKGGRGFHPHWHGPPLPTSKLLSDTR